MYLANNRPRRRRRWLKVVLVCLVVLVLAAIGGGLAGRAVYQKGLEPVNAGSEEMRKLTVREGATLDEIAKQLKDEGLIHEAWIFKLYVNLKGVRANLQAGTYVLSPSQSLEQIVAQLTHGKISTNLITILPGQRIEDIRETLIAYGFGEGEVDEALNPVVYAGHPALADKPFGASLEGYIYPESFHVAADTSARTVISLALDQMASALTPDVRAGIVAQGLTVHEGVILASIVGKEVSDKNPLDRSQAAQVFLKRLKIGMKLQSNTTDTYPPTYDTYSIPALPPGPLSNVTATSLQAVASPAATDYLYFVSGRDCVTRFSSTAGEHESLRQQYGVARAEDHCT